MENEIKNEIINTIFKYIEKKYDIEIVDGIYKDTLNLRIKIPKYKKLNLDYNEPIETIVREIEKVLELEGIKEVNFNNLSDEELKLFLDNCYVASVKIKES